MTSFLRKVYLSSGIRRRVYLTVSCSLLLGILFVSRVPPAFAVNYQLGGLSDGGGGKRSFLYAATPSNLGPFLFGTCIVANVTATLTTLTFTLGNNTLLGGQVPLYGTLQAEVFPIPWTPGVAGTCSSGQVAAPSNTLRIQDVVTNSFQAITFTFPQNTYIVTVNSGLFIGLEVTYSSYPGVNKGIELESNSGGGQFDVNQSSCGETTGTVVGNSCSGGGGASGNTNGNCGFFESCNLYLLNGVTPVAPNVAPTVSPYGSNPVTFPCCNPVTAQALQGANLRAPDVDSYPLVLLFIVLLALTLGSYLVLQARKQAKTSRQYEIHI